MDIIISKQDIVVSLTYYIYRAKDPNFQKTTLNFQHLTE